VTGPTLMVNLELGGANTHLLQIAVDLAERLAAGVIGIATCQPMQVDFGDNYVAGDLFEADRDAIAQDIKAAEAQFRSAFDGRVTPLAWRSEITFEALSGYLARQARSADLIVSALAANTSSASNATRRVDIGDLVMQAGRPVLIVPAAATLNLQRVVVAWKDTRETRRSVLDALPLLKIAAQVLVVEIAIQDDLAEAQARLDDVVGWLHTHGVAAQAQACLASGDDTRQLRQIIDQNDADLIVAGAYGHSRVREWVFGGVTDDLLLHPTRCTLVAH
jgi:nucleotide-binding universal stress UspA family protein